MPLRSRMKTSSVRFFFIITVSCFLSTEKRLHAKKLLQAFNHWQEPVYFLKFRHPQTMQIAVGVDRHRLFAAQLKHRLGCLTGGEVNVVGVFCDYMITFPS